MIKLLVYIICLMSSIFAISGLNINSIFKKNHVISAHVFRFLVILSLIYLVTNCIYDVFMYSI